MKKFENLIISLIVSFISIVFVSSCANTGSNSSLYMLLAGGSSQSSPSYNLSNDTSLSSAIGEVQSNSIVNIPFNTTLDAMKAAISVAQGAVFDIYEVDGETIATQLTSNSVIVVTAEDGTKATYTLGILPDPAIL